MRRLRAAIARLIGLVSRERHDQAFDAELDSHLQMHIDDNLRAGMTRRRGAPARAAEARRRRIDATGVPRAQLRAFPGTSLAGPALCAASVEKDARVHRHRDHDARPRHGRRRRDLRLRRRGARRATALPAADASGERDRDHAADPARHSLLPRLPRLEAAEHRVQLARRPHGPGLCAGHAHRYRAGAGRPRERRLFPHAGRGARAGPRLLHGRGPPRQA